MSKFIFIFLLGVSFLTQAQQEGRKGSYFVFWGYNRSDYPISDEDLAIVKDYRQKLRDFTSNNYILPDKPSFVQIMNA